MEYEKKEKMDLRVRQGVAPLGGNGWDYMRQAQSRAAARPRGGQRGHTQHDWLQATDQQTARSA